MAKLILFSMKRTFLLIYNLEYVTKFKTYLVNYIKKIFYFYF